MNLSEFNTELKRYGKIITDNQNDATNTRVTEVEYLNKFYLIVMQHGEVLSIDEIVKPKKENLDKLKSLCDKVNIRYKSGLNDDDQVKKMFSFLEKTNDVSILIGFDNYEAIGFDEVFKYLKSNPEAEIKKQSGKAYIKMNCKTAVFNSQSIN